MMIIIMMICHHVRVRSPRLFDNCDPSKMFSSESSL